MSSPTPPDSWPTPEDETVVSRHETLVGGTPPPTGPPPADRRIGAGMLLGLGVLALVAAGILIAWLVTHRKDNTKPATTVVVTTTPGTTVVPKVAVPRFVGLKEQDALVRAGEVGLKPKEVFKPTKAPKGTVISQRPEEGTELARGSEVTLVIDSTETRSTTTETTTTATTTAQTTTPTATTPAQPQSSTVPDVSGQTEASAVTAFGDAGLLASIVFVPSTDSLGTVVEQAKPAGTTVPFHSHVQINISRGNVTTDTTVPNVVGKSLQDAVSTLNAAHLRLIYIKYPVTSQAQAGKIVQQSPLGSSTAPQNAQVVVYLGAYKK